MMCVNNDRDIPIHQLYKCRLYNRTFRINTEISSDLSFARAQMKLSITEYRKIESNVIFACSETIITDRPAKSKFTKPVVNERKNQELTRSL